MSRLKDICIDCADPWTLGHWWAEVLGYRIREGTERDHEAVAADPIDEAGPTFWFNRVPEAKVAKNRVHVDVFGDVDELTKHGARVIEALPHWTVMTDPEGNEFCAFEPRP